MNVHEQVLRRLRRRIAALLILKHAVTFLTAWAFAWGTAVLVLRVTLAFSPLDLLWGLAAVPVLLALAAVLALRRLPSASAVRAVLDKASGCGGLLLAAAEQDLGGWRTRLPPAAGLRVRWHGGRAWTLLAAGALFLVIGLLFPERLVAVAPARSLEIGKDVERLAGQIQVLKETAILDPARAESLQEKLSRLKEHASGADPVKTLEALDHVQNLAAKAAKEAAEGAVQKTERLAKAKALAEGLHRAAGQINPQVQAEAMAELAALAQQAAAETDLLDKHLDAQTLKDCKARKLSAEQLKKLADALRGGKQDLAGMVEKLRRANLIDPEALAKCLEAGHCDSTALAEMLKHGSGKESVSELLSRCQAKSERDMPGRGGVTEGPGAAELTWGEKSSPDGTKFKEETLPPAAVTALKQSRIVGLGKGAASVAQGGEPSQPGALGQAPAGGGSAHTPVILPRHRGAVERYFERVPGK
jgi:hypothetical protein